MVSKRHAYQNFFMPKSIRQKRVVGGDKLWQAQAEKMYFEEGKKIVEIAKVLGKTRKTISKHLSSLPAFQIEKEKRKAQNQEKRQEYKKDWEDKNRKPRGSNIDGILLKRQHCIDVMVLSYERNLG